MKTAYITHPDCMLHQLGRDHPERPSRQSTIQDHLMEVELFTQLEYFDAPFVTDEQLQRVHSKSYLANIHAHIPDQGIRKFDYDTAVMSETENSIKRAAGAGVYATDLVMRGLVDNVFCNIRPPGHHAEPNRAMGFCFYNNVAVAAKHALEHHNVSNVAIIDFDAHHGNGTEAVAKDDERILYVSTFQHPFYPFTDLDNSVDNVVKVPLAANTDSKTYREKFSAKCLPIINSFQPQMIFISAGFDGHELDILSDLYMNEQDYEWITSHLMEIAASTANNRIVSVLEGGYALEPLAKSTEAHVRALTQIYNDSDIEV